ncbi:hypothetical protein BST27_08975 [Mycobacterium intermedium]|uniref:DUF4189 domain-containing protein n=1 Tax=Mycobacterium intermedium TaxID=28445 RepID=A0A1E3S1B0_MYCIE|nr:DUF4189 domain-containing protein [Mycobacterium intermedium]MCV6967430.1 DUF4189 domain-containing protein [Mycobacterium intermedium]ODQ95946.1 hypothetical protein BHQ20_29110 [Mycobacterium intermedium]OPE45452.1 hypothetical protein BV508_29585 [Mycobacterium intermedium]ORB07806.1 hypothetical protein BST27_08975 [Mycobacterium intermedium]
MRNRFLRRVALALGSVIAAVAMPFALVAPASAHTDAKQLPYWGQKYYGSIAVATDGSMGHAVRQKSRTQAEQQALQSCGSHCDIAVTFTLCGAVAHDGDRYHGGAGLDRNQAGHDAMSRLGGGRVVVTACN